jgi:hypothetical protein
VDSGPAAFFGHGSMDCCRSVGLVRACRQTLQQAFSYALPKRHGFHGIVADLMTLVCSGLTFVIGGRWQMAER